ncbi:hypothetical protein O1C12_003436 [Vibrio cholerae]|nr:hypothetical protein [Vibrio cholerae]
MTKFYQINAKLLENTQAVNKQTGEIVTLSPETKLVYSYMLNQFNMHMAYPKEIRNGERVYFESWDTIFNICCDVAKQKQKKIEKELRKLGLVSVSGKKEGRKTVYSVESILDDWEFSNPKLESFKSEVNTVKRKESKKARLEDWKKDKIDKGEWTDYKPTPEQPKIEHPQTPTLEQAPPMQQPQSNDDDNVWDPFEFDEPFADVEVITQPTPITPPPEAPKQQDINPFVLCRELLSTARHEGYEQHKANLLRIGKMGAMINAIKQGYVYNDEFNENSLAVVSGAIHAIYEHHHHEQLNDAAVLLDAKAMLDAAKVKQEVTETFSNHLSSVVISEQSYEQPEPEDYIDDLPF